MAPTCSSTASTPSVAASSPMDARCHRRRAVASGARPSTVSSRSSRSSSPASHLPMWLPRSMRATPPRISTSASPCSSISWSRPTSVRMPCGSSPPRHHEYSSRPCSAVTHPHREVQVTLIPHNPPELFPQYRGYVHALEVTGASRLLFISGLNAFERDGTTMPESFEEQAELIWKHLRTILASAGMDISNLVSLRTYLADPKFDEPNARMRLKQLGSHRVAATVICCQLLEPRWKLEIEAVASA